MNFLNIVKVRIGKPLLKLACAEHVRPEFVHCQLLNFILPYDNIVSDRSLPVTVALLRTKSTVILFSFKVTSAHTCVNFLLRSAFASKIRYVQTDVLLRVGVR